MTEDDSAVDFLYRWKDSSARRDTGHDSVSVAPGEEEPEESGELEAREGELAGEETFQPDAPPQEEWSPELFEWSADREQAIEAALEQSPAGTAPRVHLQLEAIANGLEEASLMPERAASLLEEVEAYLSQRVKAEQHKVTVAHQAFLQSRGDKLNALFSWQESASALREYLAHGDPVQLRVAHYAAEQACGLLDGALDVLLAAGEDPDDPEQSDEPEGAPSD